MIPILYKEDETDFQHNGIGALYESLYCNVFEIENGGFTLEMEYPVDGEWFSELEDFRIIQAKPNDEDAPHSFRIYEIEKSIDELSVFVRANTITNDLSSNLITHYVAVDETPQQAMMGMSSQLIDPTHFNFVSDIDTKSNTEWTRINPLQAIVGTRGSIVDIWGGQIKRTNNTIYLYSRRGTDRVATIRPGKNLEGFLMTVSTAGIRTKILPTYTYRPVEIPEYEMVEMYDGTMRKQRIPYTGDTSLQEDITVVGEPVESQYIDNYPMTYWASVDYSDDSELRDRVNRFIDERLRLAENSEVPINNDNFPNELEDFVEGQLNDISDRYFTHRNPGIDRPTVNIRVDMSQLSDSPEWSEFKDLEKIQLTDTVEVWVEKYDIDVEVRVTTLEYDSIGERVTSFNAGSGSSPRRSGAESRYEDATRKLSDYITTVENGVRNVMRNTADGLNRKFEGFTEPPAHLSSEGDIWFKRIASGKTEIWIHDGTYWQPLLTEDFADMIQAELDQHGRDLDEIRGIADDAYYKADNIASDILENVRDYIDISLEEIDFGDGFNERIEEINRMAQEALNKSEVSGEIIGNDGRTLFNRNRLEGSTERILSHDDGEIIFYHNGEGFRDNSPYVLSMKAVEMLFPEELKTSEGFTTVYLDTVTEYITLGSDD